MNRLLPNTVLGEVYQIISPIGEGASGAVYKARHLVTDECVAIKMIFNQNTQDNKVMSRFIRETQVAQKVKHPGIVKVIDAWVDHQRWNQMSSEVPNLRVQPKVLDIGD